jgi:hypothetical protein
VSRLECIRAALISFTSLKLPLRAIVANRCFLLHCADAFSMSSPFWTAIALHVILAAMVTAESPPVIWTVRLECISFASSVVLKVICQWIAGSTLSSPATTFGTIHVPSQSISPGRVLDADLGYSATTQSLWLAVDAGTFWQFRPSIQQWSWEGGSTIGTQPTWGIRGSYSPTNLFGMLCKDAKLRAQPLCTQWPVLFLRFLETTLQGDSITLGE